MEEIFPVAAGVILGLLTYTLRVWLKTVVIGALSIGLGAMAAWMSGELNVSWIYLVIDTAQVGAAASMTAFLVRAWLRRRARAVVR